MSSVARASTAHKRVSRAGTPTRTAASCRTARSCCERGESWGTQEGAGSGRVGELEGGRREGGERRQADEEMRARAPQHGEANHTSNRRQHWGIIIEGHVGELGLGAEQRGESDSRVGGFVRQRCDDRLSKEEQGRWRVAQRLLRKVGRGGGGCSGTVDG